MAGGFTLYGIQHNPDALHRAVLRLDLEKDCIDEGLVASVARLHWPIYHEDTGIVIARLLLESAREWRQGEDEPLVAACFTLRSRCGQYTRLQSLTKT